MLNRESEKSANVDFMNDIEGSRGNGTLRSTVELLQDGMYHKQIVREAMGEKLSHRETPQIKSFEEGMSSQRAVANSRSGSLKDQPNMFQKKQRIGSARGSHQSLNYINENQSLSSKKHSTKEDLQFEEECLKVISS